MDYFRRRRAWQARQAAKDRAERATLAASHHGIYHLPRAMEPVVKKLHALSEQWHSGSPETGLPVPTDGELRALRHAYLENKALEEISQSLWRFDRDPHPYAELTGTLIGMLIGAAYRMTLFVAAATYLYRAFGLG